MKVYEIVKPVTVYVFTHDGKSADGTNFAELEADVKSDSGTVERVAGDLVVIRFGDNSFTLPLGFAVFPDRVGKVIAAGAVWNDFIVADDDVVGRLERLEKAVATLNKRGGKRQEPA